MIMIPEIEYMTLLNMIKGTDPLKSEKFNLDSKIAKSLTNKKLSEDIKAKKYDWLFKQRRKIKEDIENKPQKVIIDNLASVPNVPPYLGIGNKQKPLEEGEERQIVNKEKISPLRRLKKSIKNKFSSSAKDTSVSDETNGTDRTRSYSSSEAEEFKTPEDQKPKTSKLPNRLLSPKKINNAAAYIWKNKNKFGIETTGEVKTNFNKAVKGSSYLEILKHMAGQLQTPPKGSSFLTKQLAKDPDFQKFYKTQSGSGKNKKKKLIVVKFKKIKTKKTPGLEREKTFSFKPQLWAKL